MNADDDKSRPYPDPIFSLDDWRAYLEWESSEEFFRSAERTVLPRGSTLRKYAVAGELPKEIEKVIWAAHVLNHLRVLKTEGFPQEGSVSKAYRSLLAGIRTVLELFNENPSRTHLILRPTLKNGTLTLDRIPDEEELEMFIRQLEVLENRARRAEEIVEAAGLQLDSDTGRIEVPRDSEEGGAPRRFLRHVLETLLPRDRPRNDPELREPLADELSLLFTPETLDTSPEGVLKYEIDNVYREREG